MNNITIGQYINIDSKIHKMDPRIKLLGLVIIIVSIFMLPLPSWEIGTKNKDIIILSILLGFFIFSLLLTKLAKISIIKAIRGMRGIVFLLTFTFVIQILSAGSGSSLYKSDMSLSVSSILLMIVLFLIYQFTKKYVKFKTIYFFLIVVLIFYVQTLPPIYSFHNYVLDIRDQALIKSGFILFRIAAIIVLTSLLTYTTMPTDLNFAIESLLKPLKYLKVPIEVFSMMLSLTLRAIPTLLEETEKIMKAQASRGADFKEGNLKTKIVQIISLLIPIFGISIQRAADMSNAMEVRGYIIGGKRSRIDKYNLMFSDYFSLAMSLILMTSLILVRILVL